MPITVAVAGAGALGKAILDALRDQQQYKVVVLTRKKVDEEDLPSIAIDYDDPDDVALILDHHKVHTIVCTIAVVTEGGCQSQLNLIRAAEKSKTVKRFIPSDFGIFFKEEHKEVFPLVAFKLAAADLLESTSLEFTLFHCGFFMDFYVYGWPKGTYLKNGFPLVVDIENNVAAVPGTGEDACTFTHTFDVARFVVSALGMDKWPKHLYIVGEKLSWNEVVRIVEEVKGTSFKVSRDKPEDLKDGRLAELPAHQDLYQVIPSPFAKRLLSALEYWSTQGEFDFVGETLNEVFPEIRTRKLREVLQMMYKAI